MSRTAITRMSVIGAPGMTASTAPKNPTAIEAARLITAGRVAPRANAMTRFTGPATPPFTAANQVVSVSAIFPVRLLSMPQHGHAPRIAREGHSVPRSAPVGMLSTTAPATMAAILSAMGRWQACPRGRTSAGPVRGCHPARLPRRGAVFLCVVSEFKMRVWNRGGGAPPTAMGSRCRAAVWRSAFRRRTGLRRPDQPALRRFSATTSSAHNPTTGECDRCRGVGPVGLEPTTHGLKVRCSTN